MKDVGGRHSVAVKYASRISLLRMKLKFEFDQWMGYPVDGQIGVLFCPDEYGVNSQPRVRAVGISLYYGGVLPFDYDKVTVAVEIPAQTRSSEGMLLIEETQNG